MSERILYPVIDLLGGRVVRALRDGDGQLTLVDEDPGAIALRWRDAGARWLHVVDLDGARVGAPCQLETLRAIIAAVELPAQVAGGLHDVASVEAAFKAGAARVVLNAATPDEQALVAECVARWGEKVAVALDALDGRVTVAGWLPSDAATALDLARAMGYLGVSTIILTSVSSATPDPLLDAVRRALPGVRLLAGGASGSLEELAERLAVGMDGALLGRALYEGRYTLAEAQALADALPSYVAQSLDDEQTHDERGPTATAHAEAMVMAESAMDGPVRPPAASAGAGGGERSMPSEPDALPELRQNGEMLGAGPLNEAEATPVEEWTPTQATAPEPAAAPANTLPPEGQSSYDEPARAEAPTLE